MTFAEFLKELRNRHGITTAKRLYEVLGGESTTRISLRRFQQLERDAVPTIHVLRALFRFLEPTEYRRAFLLFLKTVAPDMTAGDPLFEFFDTHTIAIGADRDVTAEATRSFYSEEQLAFLTNNSAELRFHKYVLLNDFCPVNDPRTRHVNLKRMEELGLIVVDGDRIVPSAILYRLPTYDNSSASVVAAANAFILKNLDTYMSHEGSELQKLEYAMGMLAPEDAVRILDQARSFSGWIKNQFKNDVSKDYVPLLFVNFTKQLRKIDI